MGQINQTCFKKNTTMKDNQQNKQEPKPAVIITPETNPKTNSLTVPKKVVIAEGMQRVGKHGKSHHEYIKIMNQHHQVSNFRPISMEELSQHSTKESAWCALNGIVYDVTIYLDFHPGGDILLQGCGKECAGLFNKYHPWVNGKYLLDKYQIGFLQ